MGAVRPHIQRRAALGAPRRHQRRARRSAGVGFSLLADKEIVPGRLIAGFNLRYAPERTRLHSNAETKQESTLGFAAAITARVQPGLFLGGEARYLRHYDGLGVDRLAGDALYLGPTLYARLGGTWWLSATWN